MTDTSIREDPERLDPEQASGTLIDAEHRARYLWAAQLVEGRRVLDAGCGTGYGTRLLAEHGASEVTGVDVSEVAVDQARAAVDGRARVERADLRDLPFEDGSFDVVACFEVIEHVAEQDAILAELQRVLTTDGVLAISSPNRGVYPAGNPHHVHEYTALEFQEALERQFGHVALLRQYPWLATTVTAADAMDAPGPVAGIHVHQVFAREAGTETYTAALASSAPITGVGDGIAVLAADFELGWWQEEVSARDTIIGELREDQARLGEEFHEQRRFLAASQRAHERTRTELEVHQARVAELGDQLLRSEAIGAELLDLQRRYQEVFDERRAYEGEVIAVLAAKDERIEVAERQARAVYASLSWRLTRPLRALKRVGRRSAG